MSPEKLIQSVENLQKGYTGFCTIVSVSAGNEDVNNNVGFWFEVITNDTQPVLSVQMDSFTINKPLSAKIITGKKQLQSYIKNVRYWAESELVSFFSSHKLSYRNLRLERYNHSKSA
jgi:hypothetical protein